jgi:hypothetical protein
MIFKTIHYWICVHTNIKVLTTSHCLKFAPKYYTHTLLHASLKIQLFPSYAQNDFLISKADHKKLIGSKIFYICMLSMGRGCQIALHKATVACYFEAHQHCKWEVFYAYYSFRDPLLFLICYLQLVRGLEHFVPVPLYNTFLVLLFWLGLGFSSLFLPFPVLGALFNRICQDTFSFLHLIVGNCLMCISLFEKEGSLHLLH